MRVRVISLAVFSVLLVSSVGASTSPCERVRAQLRSVSLAIEAYEIKFGRPLPVQDWLRSLKSEGILQNGFPEQDSWGHPYFYEPHVDGTFELGSVGPDGVKGSEDDQVRSRGWTWKSCKGPGPGC